MDGFLLLIEVDIQMAMIPADLGAVGTFTGGWLAVMLRTGRSCQKHDLAHDSGAKRRDGADWICCDGCGCNAEALDVSGMGVGALVSQRHLSNG